MRTLSFIARRSALAAETAESFLALITLTHPALAEPICVTSDGVSTVSRGKTFVPYPFELTLAAERDDQIDRASIAIDNIDRRITQALVGATVPPTVTIEIVLASQPDTVEGGSYVYDLVEISYDALRVTGTLAYEAILNEPIPGDIIDPVRFPGAFD